MKFRTEWYRHQAAARREIIAAEAAARRHRPRASVVQVRCRLERASVTLATLLEDALAVMGFLDAKVRKATCSYRERR